MISYIIGDIKFIGDEYIVIENNNIGYKISTSKNSLFEFDINQEYKIYTSMQVREDDISLYGFSTKDELDMFLLLISVSSIGPKNALQILSTLKGYEIKKAILSNDINTLTLAKGVGKKTASRIILELVDQVKKMNINIDQSNFEDKVIDDNETVAIEALINLGYQKNDITRVLKQLKGENLELQDLIKESLKRLV
ncbi:MAG: Holliday junction branch migration protein RuvA [Tissierellia bacterium]|nr:Holliday junction branch migration protein RuvA [Tissierellia bacterium]